MTFHAAKKYFLSITIYLGKKKISPKVLTGTICVKAATI